MIYSGACAFSTGACFMATITLGQPFDLTAPASYLLRDFPDHERYVDFDGGIRLYVPGP